VGLFSLLFLFPSSWAVGGEGYVYEGRAAAEWAKELKSGNNVEKAQHALAVLGKEAIPALMQLLKEPDPKVNAAALAVLKDVKLDMDGVALVLPMLKDESFQVRRAAVRLLGRYVQTDQAVAASLKAALQDKDKAVVEAAEEMLGVKSKLDEDPKLRKRFDKFLADSRTAAANGNMDEAKVNLDLAKSLGLDDPEARERINVTALALAEAAEKGEKKFPGKLKDAELQKARDESNRKQQLEVLLKQARILADKGDLDNAHRILREAAKLFPDDERVGAWLKNVEAKLQGKGDENAPPPDKGKKPAGDAPGKEPKQKPPPGPGEGKGKGKDSDQKPVQPPAPEGMF
jgi:tetratricopeptide (TPR) repeat protein